MNELKRTPVIIDTDPGDDDAASVLWVLANDRFDVKVFPPTPAGRFEFGCLTASCSV